MQEDDKYTYDGTVRFNAKPTLVSPYSPYRLTSVKDTRKWYQKVGASPKIMLVFVIYIAMIGAVLGHLAGTQ
jgi:hypothetical protein